MSDDPVIVSLKLCEVLERVGVSENMRKLYRDVSITREIMETIIDKMIGTQYSTYNFGSSCEGTTTGGMGSDVDVVVCNEQLIVVEDAGDASEGIALLMVKDKHAKPGYVKLQIVFANRPLTDRFQCIFFDENMKTKKDSRGRICMAHPTFDYHHYNERNGPAHTISGSKYFEESDRVFAVRCKTFPPEAAEALDRCVRCGWMSREDVERLKGFGILLVGVGHPGSEECDIEWRISFSLQERQLMLALNPTQHQCYFLLKTIKNVIARVLGSRKTLTSYHCKTCLFTAIANSRPELWTTESLVKCTFLCLGVLKHWIYVGICPNFFIKQNNMFEGRVVGEVREELLAMLRDILHQGPQWFYTIKPDRIGDALQGKPCWEIRDSIRQQMYTVLFRVCSLVCCHQNDLFEHCHNFQSSSKVTEYLLQQLQYLDTIEVVTEHTKEETGMALRLLRPVMHKLYAQQLASDAFATNDLAVRHRLLEASAAHLSKGENCDRMTGSLLNATILFKLGKTDECLRLLKQIEQNISHGAVATLCVCYPHCRSADAPLYRMIFTGSINLENIMEKGVAPCMIFLPSQAHMIPEALQGELGRSENAPTEPKDEHGNAWRKWIVVDSKIYLFFLKFLVTFDPNEPMAPLKGQFVISQLKKTLEEDQNLAHQTTAKNLLHWMLLQTGMSEEDVGVHELQRQTLDSCLVS